MVTECKACGHNGDMMSPCGACGAVDMLVAVSRPTARDRTQDPNRQLYLFNPVLPVDTDR